MENKLILNHAEIDVVVNGINIDGFLLQAIKQKNEFSFVFVFYKNQTTINLCVVLHSSCSLIYNLSTNFKQANKPYRMVQLLRSHLLGYKVEKFKQLNNSRIIELELANNENRYKLLIKLWASGVNLVLTDDNYKIIDLLHRNKKRGEEAGLVWQKIEQNDYHAEIREFIKQENISSKLEALANDFFANLTNYLLKKQFDSYLIKLKKDLEQTKITITNTANYKQIKEKASLLQAQAFKYVIASKEIVVDNYYTDNFEATTETIKLNPKLNLKQNLDAMFKLYHKTQTAYNLALSKQSEIEETIAKANDIYSKATKSNQFDDLKNLLTKPLSNFKTNIKKVEALSFYFSSMVFYVGRSATENEELLRKVANGRDEWFHVRDYSGAYVIIKNPKNLPLTQEVLLAGCALACYYSKARGEKIVSVMYTKVKYLHKPKKSAKGLVVATNEKNLEYRTNENFLKRILDSTTKI